MEVEGAYANLVVDRLLREAPLDQKERSLFTELVYGTLRWRKTVDWVLAPLVRAGLEELTPWIRNLLRLSAYQLLFLDRIPPSAVGNEAVKLAYRYGHRGVAGLVNGVLRSLARQGRDWRPPPAGEDPVGHLAVRCSHPEWMVERWIARYGFAGAEALCRVNNQPAPFWVRANTLKQTPAELAGELRSCGVEVEPSRLAGEGLKLDGDVNFAALPAHREGRFYIQDESSMLAARALAPRPGMRVVDACAGPGGKTTHIAQLMGDVGEIRAFDVHEHKLSLVDVNCRRLGVTCVTTGLRDATTLPGPLAGWADRVLVDAPCSGLGVLRRRPDLRWRKDPAEIAQLSRLQRSILQSAARCLGPGGVLVYSTCTLEPEENEEVVDWAVRHAGLRLDDLSPHLDAPGWTGEDRRLLRRGYITLLPQVHGTDGFFIARFRREQEKNLSG